MHRLVTGVQRTSCLSLLRELWKSFLITHQKNLEWKRCFAFGCLLLFSIKPAKYSIQPLQTWLEPLQMLIGWNIFKTSVWHRCPPKPQTRSEHKSRAWNKTHEPFSINHPSIKDSLKFSPFFFLVHPWKLKKLRFKNSNDMMHVSATARQNDRVG